MTYIFDPAPSDEEMDNTVQVYRPAAQALAVRYDLADAEMIARVLAHNYFRAAACSVYRNLRKELEGQTPLAAIRHEIRDMMRAAVTICGKIDRVASGWGGVLAASIGRDGAAIQAALRTIGNAGIQEGRGRPAHVFDLGLMLPLMQLWLDLRPEDLNRTSPLPRSFSEPPFEVAAHDGTCAAFVMEALDVTGADITAETARSRWQAAQRHLLPGYYSSG